MVNTFDEIRTDDRYNDIMLIEKINSSIVNNPFKNIRYR